MTERFDDVVEKEDILRIFPDYLRQRFSRTAAVVAKLQEIRLRAGREVILVMENREFFITSEGIITSDVKEAWIISEKDLEAVLNHICSYSLYAFADEIRQGYLTIPGGHRVGVAGQVILENEQVRNMKHISFLNIRISHQIIGAADPVMPHLFHHGRLYDVLIISPPGCGKTTLLRDMVRQISDGNRYAPGMNVSVVDERSEIAGCYMGMPQNDVGMRTDILDACPKVVGMMMVIRSMAPAVVAVDELGCEEDLRAMYRVMQCGSRIIATIHGDSIKDIIDKRELKEMIDRRVFGRYLILGRQNGGCAVTQIYDRELNLCSR